MKTSSNQIHQTSKTDQSNKSDSKINHITSIIKEAFQQKNFPAVAYRTYEKFKTDLSFVRLTHAIFSTLNKLRGAENRAKFVQEFVDQEMGEVFKDRTVQLLSPCKISCSACCHTQVSVTNDEAEYLSDLIIQGKKMNWTNLHVQKDAGDDTQKFMKIPYHFRSCIFLNDLNACSIYEDRPLVCRTNSVVGDPSQCKNDDGQFRTQNILNTHKADMMIMGAYLHSPKNGALPSMIWEKLKAKNYQVTSASQHEKISIQKLSDQQKKIDHGKNI